MQYFEAESGVSHIVDMVDGKECRSVCGTAHEDRRMMRPIHGSKVCMLCVRRNEKQWRDDGLEIFHAMCDKHGAKEVAEKLREVERKWKSTVG